MITEKTIRDAYVHLRTTNTSIPDGTLDFMLEASLGKLTFITTGIRPTWLTETVHQTAISLYRNEGVLKSVKYLWDLGKFFHDGNFGLKECKEYIDKSIAIENSNPCPTNTTPPDHQ